MIAHRFSFAPRETVPSLSIPRNDHATKGRKGQCRYGNKSNAGNGQETGQEFGGALRTVKIDAAGIGAQAQRRAHRIGKVRGGEAGLGQVNGAAAARQHSRAHALFGFPVAGEGDENGGHPRHQDVGDGVVSGLGDRKRGLGQACRQVRDEGNALGVFGKVVAQARAASSPRFGPVESTKE